MHSLRDVVTRLCNHGQSETYPVLQQDGLKLPSCMDGLKATWQCNWKG